MSPKDEVSDQWKRFICLFQSVSTSWVYNARRNYFIFPLFVFDKHIIFNLFSTNYKLQQVRFLLEFEMPCHQTIRYFKVARYSFSRSIPPKFERKLRRHKQRFGKIDTTVVLDKDETLLWSGLQWHRSCHGNEMTPLPTLLAAVYLGTGNCSSKIVY